MLAAMAYLLVPGVLMMHGAVAHAGTAGQVAQDAHHDEHHDHHAHGDHEKHGDHDDHDEHGHSDSDESCVPCHIAATLSHATPSAAPMMSVAIDVTSPEYVFLPEAVCLAADVDASPASPRAPPRL